MIVKRIPRKRKWMYEVNYSVKPPSALYQYKRHIRRLRLYHNNPFHHLFQMLKDFQRRAGEVNGGVLYYGIHYKAKYY